MLAQVEEAEDPEETSRMRDAAWEEFIEQVRRNALRSSIGLHRFFISLPLYYRAPAYPSLSGVVGALLRREPCKPGR